MPSLHDSDKLISAGDCSTGGASCSTSKAPPAPLSRPQILNMSSSRCDDGAGAGVSGATNTQIPPSMNAPIPPPAPSAPCRTGHNNTAPATYVVVSGTRDVSLPSHHNRSVPAPPIPIQSSLDKTNAGTRPTFLRLIANGKYCHDLT